jgi:hypothetical protein
MKNKVRPAALFFAAMILFPVMASASLSAGETDAPFSVSGSVLNESGYIGLRPDIPDSAARDWYSLTSANARFSREGEQSRFFSSVWAQADSATGGWTLSLDEAWFELRMPSLPALRLGRFPLSYGPCIAFNPANSLISRDTFDDRAGKVGFDGVSAEIQALPGSVVFNAAFLLPGESSPAGRSGAETAMNDIGESVAHGRLTVYLGEKGIFGATEIGVSGDFRRLGLMGSGEELPAAGGAWISADIAGFVAGAEASLRNFDGTGEYAFSLNRKAGDFFAVIEALCFDEGNSWQGFARLSRRGEDTEISVSALFDFETRAARTGLEMTWNASDFLVLGAEGIWNCRAAEWGPEGAGALPMDWAAGISLECFF